MTLIPMMSAIAATPRRTIEPVAGRSLARGGYNPGAGHRPIAAALAIGLPAALVVAVALSPMVTIITHKDPPIIVETVPIPVPTPDPDPNPRQREQQPATVTTVPTPLPPVPSDPPIVDRLPPYEPPAGSGSGPTVADPPAPAPKPALVLAELDQRYAAAFQPDYPASEQRREIEGSVRVRVLIGTDGRVKAIEQLSSDSPGFFEETRRRALAKWRFKPATRGGIAEESWKVMTVHFRIRNG